MKKYIFLGLCLIATSLFALESDVSNALPSSGGTLTGALSGTSASFTSLAVSSNTNAGLPLVIGAGSTPTLTVNTGLTTFGGGASANTLRFQNTTTGTGSGNGLQIYQDDVASIIFYENNLFQLGTNSNAIINMLGSNVGISTGTPTYNLDVWNTSGGLTGRFSTRSTTSNFVDFCADSGAGQGTTLGFYDNTAGARSGYIKYAYDTDLMSFRINGVETFFLANGGNVGIGATPQAQKLEVYGNILSTGASPQVRIDATSGNPGYYLYKNGVSKWAMYTDVSNDNFHIRDSASGYNPISITAATGNVGISSSTPMGLLTVGAGSTPALMVNSDGTNTVSLKVVTPKIDLNTAYEVGVATPTAVGQLMRNAAFELYISSGTDNAYDWVKVGSQ